METNKRRINVLYPPDTLKTYWTWFLFYLVCLFKINFIDLKISAGWLPDRVGIFWARLYLECLVGLLSTSVRLKAKWLIAALRKTENRLFWAACMNNVLVSLSDMACLILWIIPILKLDYVSILLALNVLSLNFIHDTVGDITIIPRLSKNRLENLGCEN